MNNKELIVDFINYAKSRHIVPILDSNIEPLVEDYFRQQNLQQCNVSGSGFDEDDEWDESEPCPTCGDIDGMVNPCCAGYDPLHYKNCGYG